MRWRLSKKGGRRPATSIDPVAAAITAAAAGGPLIARHPDVVPKIGELPEWIDVHDSDDIDGFNTVVWFDDEITSYCDPYGDGLDQALAEQPGVEEILAEDREVVYLRTKLDIADVKAAVIRSVVEVNRSPREPGPTGALSIDTVDRLASAVLPLLEQAGFAKSPTGLRYFYREGSDGFIQSIAVAPGVGISGDGTNYAGLVWVMSGTHVPGFGGDVPSSPDRVAPAHCGQPAYHWVAPTIDALTRVLRDEVLPVLNLTRGRLELAGWVAGDPARVPVPNHRPTYARLFAQWGLIDQAALVVRHIDAYEPSLRHHRDTIAAGGLIRDARR